MKDSAMQWGIRGMVVAFSGLLNSCAVLTVDVDVYKGPLVNEEGVQIQQLLALTTAAKPMLVQLRDNLEWANSDGLPPKWATCFHKNWYRADYVKEPDGFVSKYKSGWETIKGAFSWGYVPCQEHFENPHARRVNEILRLYGCLGSDGTDAKQPQLCEGRGLDQLVAKYYEQKAAAGLNKGVSENKGNQDKLAQTRDKLLDELVRFSQKVLFTANHEGLLSPPGTPGLIVGGAADLNRGLFGDLLTDYKFSPYRLFQLDAQDAGKSPYVRVLQAVGNSILFSVNELRAREQHREAGKDKAKTEVAAVNASYSVDPRKVLDDLLKELEHEKDNADKQKVNAETRQTLIRDQIGNSTLPLTGLRADKKTATDVLDTATQTLATYRNDSTNLKAINGVLIDEVVKNIQAQWTREGKETSDVLEIFLTGPEGLAVKIENRSIARQCASTNNEECERVAAAVTYVKEQGTKDAFKRRQEEGGPMPVKWTDMLDKFVEHIRLLKNDRENQEAKLDKDRDQQDKKHKKIEAEIATLEGELKEVKDRESQLTKNVTDFKNAWTAIDKVKSGVLKEAETHVQFASPSAVYLLVSAHLLKAEKVETDGESFQKAQVVLSGRTPPAGGLQLGPAEKYKSPMAVMDELIALLRHRHIYAVERYGKGSEEDKKATEALESAYQHRAGMIYIRPSSAYLRTSFPSTSLQDDPNLTWDNMLLQQGIRSLPFSSELRDILDPSVRRDRLLTSELDKQYWQNINRVRISGVGRTNQVVAKDDVGNWYVKQYSSDPKDIIKSAKNLALFNLGMNLPIDLAGELKKAAKPVDDLKSGAGAEVAASSKSKEDIKAETGVDTPPLNRVFEKHRNAYQTKTTEDSTRLEALHTKTGTNTVHDQIVKAWGKIDELKGVSSSMDALKAVLDVAIQEWDEAVKALKKKPDQDQGQLIIKDLRALSRLERSLSEKIQEIDKGSMKAEEVRLTAIKNKAKAEVRRVVEPIVMDMLKDRKQTLDSYDQAIMFIGDATNPKDSSQKQSN